MAGGQVTATSATLTVTLTNDPAAKQTLGSANFIPPGGVTFPASPPNPVVRAADQPGWTVAVAGGIVTFRSTSNPLGKGASVSADVLVNVSQTTCNPVPPSSNATWTTQAKQSNDFSGAGNDFQLDSQSSDLIPLGRFDIATIETVTDELQHVPAIVTGVGQVSTTTAYDICGEGKTTYSGATRSATLLTGASYDPSTGLNWVSGVGTVTITPAVTETDNQLHVLDEASGVTADSNFFDTTDRLCTSTATDPDPCEWSNQGGKIKVNADHPPEDASLGIGFNPTLSFDCNNNTTPVGDTLVNINPRYELTEVEAIEVTLTYEKSARVTGRPPASTSVSAKTRPRPGARSTNARRPHRRPRLPTASSRASA